LQANLVSLEAMMQTLENTLSSSNGIYVVLLSSTRVSSIEILHVSPALLAHAHN
jgi:hypothetical protein